MNVERRLFVGTIFSLVVGCGGSTMSGTNEGSGSDGGPSGNVSSSRASASASGGGSGGAAPSSACQACVTDADCGAKSVCAQFAGDTYCAPLCENGSTCSSDKACTTLSTASGDQVNACVPRGDVCGTNVAADSRDAGSASRRGGDATCGDLHGPDVPSNCTSCGSRPCQANGCYGGWFCNISTNKCQRPPAHCGGIDGGGGRDGGGSGGPPGPYDGGSTVTSSIGPNGGTASRLRFAVVGDTRPAVIDDTSAYPTAVIEGIYSAIQAESPAVPFALSTGDYVFARADGAEAPPQFDLYMAARSKYSGMWFPTMGNHECTGMTASNCGAGNKDGETNNFTTYLAKALGPIQKTDPYYAINITATDNAWTSKFVFVAANAWSQAQAAWLRRVLAQPTTYTFIVRHEPAAASTAPGVTPSEQLMAQYPYTLAITGHTHTYAHPKAKEIIVGNGGAPLTGGATYGYALLNQRSDGAIVVDMIDYATGQADTNFRFAVAPDGSATP